MQGQSLEEGCYVGVSKNWCYCKNIVSMRRCFKSLVTAACIVDRCLYDVHTFLHQSTNSVVKPDCLVDIDLVRLSDVRKRHFDRSYLKANKVNKSEGAKG